VALIPIDLPRTVSIRNTEEDINPRSRANSVCASPAFVKGHGRQASRTKNAIDDDPKQLALQQAEYERRKIAEMDDITTPLGRMRAGTFTMTNTPKVGSSTTVLGVLLTLMISFGGVCLLSTGCWLCSRHVLFGIDACWHWQGNGGL
jgi:hypothetical protein